MWNGLTVQIALVFGEPYAELDGAFSMSLAGPGALLAIVFRPLVPV